MEGFSKYILGVDNDVIKQMAADVALRQKNYPAGSAHAQNELARNKQQQIFKENVIEPNAGLPMELATMIPSAIQNTRGRLFGVAAGLGNMSAGGDFESAYREAVSGSE